MKGRKPALRVIEGGRPSRVPVAPATLPPCGRAEWRRVAPLLKSQGRLGPGIVATVEAYCTAVGMARAFDEVLTRDGWFLETEERGKVPHPAFKMRQDAAREARLLAAELQLTRGGKVEPDTGKGGWRDDADLLA